MFLEGFVVKARGGFVGDCGCEITIASAQPVRILLPFLVIPATSRNDVARKFVPGLPWCLRLWFSVSRVASEDDPGFTYCLRRRSLVKL